jgi:serine/threonine protein kinase
VLDFGLAKLTGPAEAGHYGNNAAEPASQSPTITTPAATRAGVILGTAAYMSPEQARGREVDKRTDIWAFGCVLYEMLTGSRAFGGDNVSDTLAGILRGEPDWAVLPATTPVAVRRLLHRCLEKDPKRRLRDIGDMSVLSEELAGLTAQTAQAPIAPRSGHRERVAWALAAILAAAGIALAIPSLRRVPADAPAIRFSVSPPQNVTLTQTTSQLASLAVSPDGRRVAFVATRAGELNRLWVRSFDSLEAEPLSGTETALNPSGHPTTGLSGSSPAES